MGLAARVLSEYGALCGILGPWELMLLAGASMAVAPRLLRSGRLTALDAAMSRNMTVRFGGARMVLPLADMDRALAAHHDNPSFGNVREMYGRNCYLQRLRLKTPVRRVLDLGANRGMFSLLALAALGAEVAVAVEPGTVYEGVHRQLMEANGYAPGRSPRYAKFVASPGFERSDPSKYVSIPTILREQKMDRLDLVKMDIEGHEGVVFSEPEWLASVDTLTMELHPDLAGDLSPIPRALREYGFDYRMVDQAGVEAEVETAMFLYASRVGALAA